MTKKDTFNMLGLSNKYIHLKSSFHFVPHFCRLLGMFSEVKYFVLRFSLCNSMFPTTLKNHNLIWTISRV